MKRWKQWLTCAALSIVMVTAGCGSAPKEEGAQKTELTVFAAASMTETMEEIAAEYEKAHPDITITFNFDSSGTLKQQIQNGAACDIFISAAPKQMNQLDKAAGEKENPEGLDAVMTETRVNLLENKVVLAVPEGNPKHVTGFDDMAGKLADGSIRLAMGNSDVPAGQYTQRILAFYGIDERAAAERGCITYGSNVKEVTTHVAEGSADCGVIYGTDAYSAGLEPVDEATAEMCGQVIYPAAVMKASAHPEEAKAFLDYLKGDEAMTVFKGIGFSPAGA